MPLPQTPVEWLQAAFMIGLFGLIFVVGPWYYVRNRRRMREAARNAGFQLGFTKIDFDGGDWEAEEAYQGELEGMVVTIVVGSKVAEMAGAAAPISAVVLEACPREPAAFEYSLHRVGGVYETVIGHPQDAEFSAKCCLESPDPARAAALFEDAGLRASVTQVLQDGQGSASIDQNGARFIVFDAASQGPSGVMTRARELAVIARYLSDRARQLSGK